MILGALVNVISKIKIGNNINII